MGFCWGTEAPGSHEYDKFLPKVGARDFRHWKSGGFILKRTWRYPLVNQHGNGKWTFWRCIPHWTWWYSIAMLVYWRVHVFFCVVKGRYVHLDRYKKCKHTGFYSYCWYWYDMFKLCQFWNLFVTMEDFILPLGLYHLSIFGKMMLAKYEKLTSDFPSKWLTALGFRNSSDPNAVWRTLHFNKFAASNLVSGDTKLPDGGSSNRM